MSLNKHITEAIEIGIDMLIEGATESSLYKYFVGTIGISNAGQLSKLCVDKFNNI